MSIANEAPRCFSRLKHETSRQTESESQSVFPKAKTIRQNSPKVVPPTIKVIARIGTKIRSALKDRSIAPTSFPAIISNPLRSVRKRKPRVPSRFSSLIASEVLRNPSKKQNRNAAQLKNQKKLPCPRGRPSGLLLNTTKKAAISS